MVHIGWLPPPTRSLLKLPSLTASRASMMLVAWLVEPDASGVLKFCVDFPKGRLSMKGVMSTPFTHRPSSARTCKKEGETKNTNDVETNASFSQGNQTWIRTHVFLERFPISNDFLHIYIPVFIFLKNKTGM